MTRLLHLWWQVTAVVIFTAVLVLQIPRRALFFKPARAEQSAPFVSLLSLDDKEYAKLVQQMRMSWQIRGRTMADGVADSRTDAFSFSDPMPPPSYLPHTRRATAKTLPPPDFCRPSLLPPSLGENMPRLTPPPVTPDRDSALLALPEVLSSCGTPPDVDFTLKMQRRLQ